MSNRTVSDTAKAPYLTRRDVLNAHAEFGKLDFNATKEAMGPNWPAEWERFKKGGGIFERVAISTELSRVNQEGE